MSQQETNHRKFYYSFGIETRINGTQLIGDCPLCGKENHFYANKNTGQWECKSCTEKGNNWSFLQKLHASLLEQPQDYSWLVGNRFLKTETFEHAEIVESPTGDWLIPVRNQKGAIVNLYKGYQEIKDDKEKLIVISSPAPCTQHLYGVETVTSQQETIYIVEGHWDRLALIEIMAHLAPHGEDFKLKGIPNYENEWFQKNAIVAVPGASTFKTTWLPLLRNKNVILIFDNDKPGRAGCDRLVKMIQESSHRPQSLSKAIWEDSDVNDIRDLLVEKQLSYLKAYRELNQKIIEISTTPEDDTLDKEISLEERECHSFKELIEKLTYDPETDIGLHMTDNIKYSLAAMLCVVISTVIKGGQLGLRVRGPASSAKSTLAELLSQNDEEFTFPRDTFTGIISGSLKKSNMMAKRMDGKCLIIKEADTIMNMPNLQQIESELRAGLGDGVIRSEYRNSDRVAEIHSLFTCIMCGTNRIKDIDDASLGSRFYDIVIHTPETDTTDILDSALKTAFQNIQRQLSGEADEYDDTARKSIIMRVAPFINGFLRHKSELIRNYVEIAPLTPEQDKRAKALANLLAYGRAKVERDKQKNLKRRGEKEVPARIGEGLMRFLMLLPVVLYNNKKFKVTNQVFDIVKKIVRDSSEGWQFQIIELIYANKNQPITSEKLAETLGLSKTHIENITRDMKELKILETASEKLIAGRGRMAHCHTLTPELWQLCKEGLK